MTDLTHLVVLDFEATCDDKNPPDPQEIIEFPSVLLRTDTFAVVDEFEAFVRPVHHPTLTTFCRELTSIEQADVDAAKPFPEVLDAHLGWLASHGLPTEAAELPYALVTCGDWDLRSMFPAQLRASSLDYVPQPYRQWINVKVPFKNWNRKQARTGMARMLELLDLKLEGRHHRGIDDSRNIAKIVRALVARHQRMEVTTKLPASRYPKIEITLQREGFDEQRVTLTKRTLGSLLGTASSAFRRQATRVFEGERELADADLLDLSGGAILRVA
ncbi:MAG: 3'-5' exonuclease [Myxococcota bacterium]